MYKILIVDDEKEIREGLAAWDWKAMGFAVAGTSAHGLEALQIISQEPVDVVLTDIRMPFMNGLELMETMKRRYPFTKVMILSGYSDFEYAKRAIQNGAGDYLLKPVKDEELREAFQRLAARLDAEKQDEYRRAILERKEKLLTQLLRRDFLERLVRQEMDAEDLEQSAAEGEVLLEHGPYTVAAIRLDRVVLQHRPLSEREAGLIAFSLDNILQEIWDGIGNRYHLVDTSRAVFYLLAAGTVTQEDFLVVLRQLERFTGLLKSTLSIGIGQSVDEPGLIRRSALSAEAALADSREESAVTVFDAFRMDLPPEGTGRAAAEAESDQSVDEATRGLILGQAKQYIRDNYNRTLTLKEVAAHVYISPGHLSALFKQSGTTFLKYLTGVRMDIAMELLADLSKKIYEVVEMVGYSDPAYFSELFKKYTGKTPNEYRSSAK